MGIRQNKELGEEGSPGNVCEQAPPRVGGLGLPLSFLAAGAGRGEQSSQVSPFWKKGGAETVVNGHLSWTQIPEQLILWPAQQTSGTRNSAVISRDETLKGLFTHVILRARRQGRQGVKFCAEENLAGLLFPTAVGVGGDPGPVCVSVPVPSTQHRARCLCGRAQGQAAGPGAGLQGGEMTGRGTGSGCQGLGAEREAALPGWA